MYFNSKNNFYHGIMFHQFHDNNLHKKSDGSIDKDDFYKIIKYIGRENILNADDFFNRFRQNKLDSKKVCFTFDDSIKCQYDIALPILEEFKIKSFFFIYTSLIEGEPDLLEIYRYFRFNYFKNINYFYDEFYKNLDKNLTEFFKKNEQIIKEKKLKFPFYSIEDIKFRLVRDELLNSEEYKSVMSKMFESKNFIPKDNYKNLFLNSEHLIELKKLGHLIGLHSHTHPMSLEKLTLDQQLNEYEKNINILSSILKINKNEIKFMSHPCGSYDSNTLKILNNLGIELGFKQLMTVEPERGMKKINNSFLEIARQDHSQIMNMINR